MWTPLVAAYASLAVVAGLVLLRRAFARPVLLLEELAVAMSCVFLVGGALWLWAWVADATFLGFGSPWTWLTAAHFHVAGFGALLISALATRATRSPQSRRAMRALLVLHPLAFACVAAGLAGIPHADRVGAFGYMAIFVAQAAVVGVALVRAPADAMRARGAARTAGGVLLLTALLVPIVTLVPAAAWALDMPVWNLDDMVRYHGIANAVGHAVLGLLALAILRPMAVAGVSKAPMSRLRARGRVGPGFLAEFAPSAPQDPTGLSDDLGRYARDGFDVTALHRDVRDFYEHTREFELDVDGQWRAPFRSGGWLWANVISPRLGQLGLPSPRQTLEGAALDSRIVDVDDTRDGRVRVRGWVRTWRSTGAPIYIAAYAEHQRDGIRYMNIAFPLPGACLTSILHLSRAGESGLQLTSRHHEHFDGDQGIYLARGASPFRLPMDETITVWPVASEGDAKMCLEARHDMWLFGLRFLTLRYRIRRAAGSMSDRCGCASPWTS